MSDFLLQGLMLNPLDGSLSLAFRGPRGLPDEPMEGLSLAPPGLHSRHFPR